MHIDQDVLVEGKRLTDKRKSELANQTPHQTPDRHNNFQPSEETCLEQVMGVILRDKKA